MSRRQASCVSGLDRLRFSVIVRHRVSPLGEPDDRLQRTIQYSAPPEIPRNALGYWMPRFCGA
jgi:hypothetical protein